MRSSILTATIAGTICLGALVVYGIAYSAVTAKNSAVVALQNNIDARKEAATRISYARVALSEISGDEAIIQNYFVPEAGVVAFIDDLQARGRAENASVAVLSVSTDIAGARPMLVLSISIKGIFDAMMRTIGSIENAPYDISLSALSIVQDGKNEWHADAKLVVGSSISSTTTP